MVCAYALALCCLLPSTVKIVILSFLSLSLVRERARARLRPFFALFSLSLSLALFNITDCPAIKVVSRPIPPVANMHTHTSIQREYTAQNAGRRHRLLCLFSIAEHALMHWL